MIMEYSLRIHKGVSLFGFILLIGVLFYLTYNTFKLKNAQFQLAEKAIINEWYTGLVRNDKVFPGGITIINRYLMGNIYALESMYLKDTLAFERTKNAVLDSMFVELREANPMDSLFAAFKTASGLDQDLNYLLTINAVQLVFKNFSVVKIYNQGFHYPPIPDSLNTANGLLVGGSLKTPLPQNRVTSLTVSSPDDYNYWITFSLHADQNNRTWHVIKLMLPTFLLALFAIACTVSVYYITFRNWLRQKKLAEMKSDFVNSITHEFNTPLSTIIVANKNLQNEEIQRNPSNIQPLTKIIERQSLRLQKLFDQVLDITTMDNSSLQKDPFDLGQLLQEIIMDYGIKVSEQHVNITFRSLPRPVTVELNKFFFTTMMYNLFDNAVKHNRNTQKSISVSIDSTGPIVHLTVADNGKGIADEEARHVFEKFYRASKVGDQSVTGLGLGLYYTYQCIKSHGWQISVTSEIDVGSKFVITMQLKE